MEILLITLGIIILIVGYVSCVLPPLPGPPVAFIALLFLQFGVERISFSSLSLISIGTISVLVTIVDNFVAVWGTKKFGGTKAGIRGSFIGLIAGIFFLTPVIGPFSIIAGPFIGAIVGEVISGQSAVTSIRSGVGSFIGFLLGLGMKLILTSWIAYLFFKSVFWG
jgi:uncharacterized protein YqgC (DUF456 family)